MKIPQGEIDPKLCRRILSEGYDMGIRRVGFYTTGEMFLCNAINEHIRAAKSIGYEYIYSDTNGALATKDKLLGVIQSGLDSIKFSINAGTRETYAEIHGRDDFEVVLQNLKFCYELKQKYNPNLLIMVSFVVTRKNENEIEFLKEKVSPYIDRFMCHPVNIAHLPKEETKSSKLLPVKFEEVYHSQIPCPMVFHRVHITYNGYLTACCADFNHDLLMADLKTQSLEQAWNSDNFRKLRKAHKERAVEGLLCEDCARNTL